MNQIITVKKFVFGGSCISEIEGKTVFIPFCLPGEKVSAEIVKENKKFAVAVPKKILEPSNLRTKPKCPYFYKCGGCNMQMAEDGYQKTLRQSAAKEALLRSGIQTEVKTIFESGADWEYRARFQFHAENGQAGLKKSESAEIIPIKDCPVAVPEIREFLKNGADIFPKQKNGERFHIFAANGNVYSENNGENCSVSIAGKKIRFSPKAFFQSNLKMTERLIPLIFDDGNGGAGRGRFLDFCSGVGTFSCFAADYAEEIHLLDINKLSLLSAKENVERALKTAGRKAEIFLHKAHIGNWGKFKESHLHFDSVIADPPRSGLDKNSLNWFCSAHPPKFFYVSCDPVTFARDARILLNSGYKLEKHYLLDFYPQTHHIETLGIFKYEKK